METYILKKDLFKIKAGTKYIQHPEWGNRFYPESEYEKGKLIRGDSALYAVLKVDVENNHEWFEKDPTGWDKIFQSWKDSPKNDLHFSDFFNYLKSNFSCPTRTVVNYNYLKPEKRPGYIRVETKPDFGLEKTPEYFEYVVTGDNNEKLAFKQRGKWTILNAEKALDKCFESINRKNE